MIGQTIAFVLGNLPAFSSRRGACHSRVHENAVTGPGTLSRLAAFAAGWRFGPVGGALSPCVLPALVAAAQIGWAPSPFQFEVGMADLAIGAAACLSFWRDLSFKAAVVMINAIFLAGDAVGHVRQMIAAGNFAPGNAGTPFFADIILPVLTIALLFAAHRSQSAEAFRTQ